ncbi:MAG: preprotein translocase subunit YajC, partial [Acutalibacteraceae bacterium]
MKKIIALLSVAAAAMLTFCSCVPANTGANGAANSANNSGGIMNNMWFMILIYVLIFAALYFFMIRPNSKRKKQEQAMRDNLEIGDEITTIGGIM